MQGAVGVASVITLRGWLIAEGLLQARQFLRSGRTERTEWRSFLVLGGLTLAGLWLAGRVNRAAPALSYHLGAPAGAVLLVAAWAGIALRLWAIIALGRFFRGTVHIQQDHQVVRSGPYRWVRHPSYSGMLLGAAALAVWLGNPLSWLAAMGCILAAILYRIRVEERVLGEALGERYLSYAAGTRRLIPGVW